MKEFNKTVVLTMDEATHPDIEELGKYDLILLPSEFMKFTNKVIRLLYAPLNVGYFKEYLF